MQCEFAAYESAQRADSLPLATLQRHNFKAPPFASPAHFGYFAASNFRISDAESTMTTPIRTRFAPSPTGYLHIGGARTALFNYLLAKRLGGVFALRIEDTDQTRNIEAADQKLLNDLRWLGLNWDEGPEVGGVNPPYHQSQRLAIYKDHAQRLLDSGRAYYAFETREELDAMRKLAQQHKRAFRYPRPSSFPSEADATQARSEGRPVVVRFKMPDHGFTIRDQILGEVSIAARELDDFVIIKGDGWPTYHFAVVVDDALMQVTHVLRGQEHLMNTPNHMGLQEAFGYPTPAYAHLPIILNMDGSKMSKREKDRAVRAAADAALKSGALDEAKLAELAGADAITFAAWRDEQTQLEGQMLARLARRLTVQLPEIEIHDFRTSGYLPEVLNNFIALLGWSPGDNRERMSMTEMCEAFALERIGKTNARFDRAKLLNFNTVALSEASPERRLAGLRDYLSVNTDSPLRELPDGTLKRLIEMNEGFRLFRDIEEKTGPLFMADEAVVFNDKAVKDNLLKNDGAGLGVLRALQAALAALSDWSPTALDAAVRTYAEQHSLGLGKVAQPLRVAVTGTSVSPPIFDTLALLGRETALRRIQRTVQRFATGSTT